MANPNRPKTILCLGASNTICTYFLIIGQPEALPWPTYLRMLASGIGPGWTVVNGGVNSATVFDVHKVAPTVPCEQLFGVPLLHSTRPDIVILVVESNDAQYGPDHASTPAKVVAGIKHFEQLVYAHPTASGTRPLFFTTYTNLAGAFYHTPLSLTASGFTHDFNTLLPTLVSSGQCIDFATGLAADNLYIDELHYVASAQLTRGWRAYEKLLPYLTS